MKIVIKAIRFKDIPYAGGTFRKYEVKTDKTGEEILESRFGKRNEKIKIGDTVEGYIEKSFYMGKNGRVDTKLLRPITSEYVLELLKKLAPGIESQVSTVGITNSVSLTPAPKDDGFGTPIMTTAAHVSDGFDAPAPDAPPADDIGW